MRIIGIIGLVLISKFVVGQQVPTFELTKNGISPIVVTVDTLDASALYQRSLSWVQEYYKEEKNALQTDVQNQKIQINGIKKNAWQYFTANMSIQYDVEYVLLIDFENNRMKMSVELGKTWDHTEGKVANSYFIDYRKIWKENGEVHKIYQEAKPGIDQMMNDLSNSLVSILESYTAPTDAQNKSEKGKLLSRIKF